MRLGRLRRPSIVTPFVGVHDLARLRALAVAARLGGEVDDDRAVAHVGHRVRGDQLRRRAAGDERGGDDDVGLGDLDLQRLALALLLLLGELARVAAGGLGVADALDLEELRAQRLDLLLDRGADVEGGHDRAEAPRGGDRLQPGDARAEHEHLGGRDRARGGHQHREEARQLLGGDDHREVAGDRGLRGQRVHRLRARDARDRLHREGGRAGGGDPLQAVGVRERGEEADQDGVPPSFAASSSEGGATFRTASASQGSPTRRAGLLEERVGDAGAGARAGLEHDLVARAGSLRTISGTSATRRSPGAVSVGTPIRKGGNRSRTVRR